MRPNNICVCIWTRSRNMRARVLACVRTCIWASGLVAKHLDLDQLSWNNLSGRWAWESNPVERQPRRIQADLPPLMDRVADGEHACLEGPDSARNEPGTRHEALIKLVELSSSIYICAVWRSAVAGRLSTWPIYQSDDIRLPASCLVAGWSTFWTSCAGATCYVGRSATGRYIRNWSPR